MPSGPMNRRVSDLAPVSRPKSKRPQAGTDAIWEAIRAEVRSEVDREPILASFLHATILKHHTLEDALSFHLASKLGGPSLADMLVREVFDEAFVASPEIGEAIRRDLSAVKERDPATETFT